MMTSFLDGEFEFSARGERERGARVHFTRTIIYEYVGCVNDPILGKLQGGEDS